MKCKLHSFVYLLTVTLGTLVALVYVSCSKGPAASSKLTKETQEPLTPVEGDWPPTSGDGAECAASLFDGGNGTVGVKNANQYYKGLLAATGTTTPSAAIRTAYNNFRNSLPPTGSVCNISGSARYGAIMLSGYIIYDLITSEMGKPGGAQGTRVFLNSVPPASASGAVSGGSVLSDDVIREVVQAAIRKSYRREAMEEEIQSAIQTRNELLGGNSNPSPDQNRFALQVILNVIAASLDMIRS